MKELRSPFFKSDTSRKLYNCLNYNYAHLTPGTRDPVIFYIQEALRALKESPAIDGENNYFGPKTVAAVTAFKRRYIAKGEPLDNNPIVGTGTIDLLDRLLAGAQGAIIDPPPPPPPPNPNTKVILVEVVGQQPNGSSAGKPTTAGQGIVGIASVDQFAKMVNNKQLVHAQWNGGMPQFNTDPTNDIVAFIKDKAGLAADATKAGTRILITGASSGGRVAVTVAAALKKDEYQIRYVGLADAAFTGASDGARRLSFAAKLSQNFFQDITNASGSEFHGSVDSSQTNKNLSDSSVFTALRKQFAEASGKSRDQLEGMIHTAAVTLGYSEIRTVLVSLLKKE